nr:unnamed protein product [Spirometra erinaceieuropaei]
MDSGDAICAQLSAGLYKNADELANLWNYVGFDEAERAARTQTLNALLEKVFAEFIQAENATVLELNTQIEACRRQTAEACQSLGLPPYLPERGLTICQLKKDLEEKLKELQDERAKRIADYRNLRKELLRISVQMGLDAESIKRKMQEFPPIASPLSSDGQVPTLKELARMNSLLEDNKASIEPLVAKFRGLQADILRLSADIDYQPQNAKEQSLLAQTNTGDQEDGQNEIQAEENGECGVDIDTEIQAVQANCSGALPTEDDLQELANWRLRMVKEKARLVGSCDELRGYLRSMWTRLGRSEKDQEDFISKCSGYKPTVLSALEAEADACRKERLKTIRTYLPRLKDEATELARSCFVEAQELAIIEEFTGNDEALVDYLEKRIEELKTIYQRHRQVYDGIANFQSLWRTFLEVEQRMRDPAILSNRGGILLKTEKEKKRLLKEIQKAEAEANAAIEHYEREKGEVFRLSNGKTFQAAAEEQWMELKGPRDSSSRGGKRNSSVIGRKPVSAGGDQGPPGAPV